MSTNKVIPTSNSTHLYWFLAKVIKAWMNEDCSRNHGFRFK